MKFLNCLLILSLLYSCSKTNPDDTDAPFPLSGAVNGTIKGYDKYGTENSDYKDVTIQLIDKQGKVSNGLVNGNGTFQFKNVLFGDVTLVVTKPGYGFMDSVTYNHQKNTDTLTNIYLIEELPFSCYLAYASYSNSFFSFYNSYNYPSTDSYMVAKFFCFSKEPEASINQAHLLWNSGSQMNVQYITGDLGGGFTLWFKSLTDAGFREGDQIYVREIPAIEKFWTCYNDQNRNYKVLHYKVGNASNVLSFTLHQ